MGLNCALTPWNSQIFKILVVCQCTNDFISIRGFKNCGLAIVHCVGLSPNISTFSISPSALHYLFIESKSSSVELTWYVIAVKINLSVNVRAYDSLFELQNHIFHDRAEWKSVMIRRIFDELHARAPATELRKVNNWCPVSTARKWPVKASIN